MPGSLPLYQYQSLQTRQIRVLYLDPGEYDEPLRCCIEDVSLDSVDFVAISYVWGDSQKKAQITVQSNDGSSTLYLTKSLDVLLRDVRAAMTKCADERLRDHEHLYVSDEWLYRPLGTSAERSAFWVDQISINQDDLEEKAAQVSLMGSIFEMASCVISYTGPREPHHDRGIKMLFAFMLSIANAHIEELRDVGNYPKLIQLDRWAKDDWISLSEVLDREWLSRIWIVQESVLNRRGRIMCGDRVFCWTTLNTIALLYTKWQDFQIEFLAGRDHLPKQTKSTTGHGFREHIFARVFSIHALEDVRKSFLDANRMTLMQLLCRFRNFDCSDPRDHIFALLSLASDAQDLGIVPSYYRSYEDIFTDFTRTTIQRTRTLRILSHACGPRSNLPSWVPDWTLKTSLYTYDPEKYHVAAGDWPLNPWFESNDVLVVDGILVDEIAKDLGSWTIPNVDGYLDANIPGTMDQTLSIIPEVCRHFKLDILNLSVDDAKRVASFLQENPTRPTLTNKFIQDSQLAEELLKGIKFLRLGDAVARKDIDLVKDIPDYRQLVLEYARFPHKYQENITIFFGGRDCTAFGKNICVTLQNRLCTSRTATQPGDRVAVLSGGSMCYILRPIDDTGDYQFVSDCYLEGFMHGEALESPDLASKTEKIRIA